MTKIFSLFFLILFTVGSRQAFAYGHFSYESLDGKASLVFPVIRDRRIHFCSEIEDTKRFPPDDIDREIVAALRVWLAPVEEIGIKDVRIEKVSCDADTLNLKVFIGSDKVKPKYSAHQRPVKIGDRLITMTTINTDSELRVLPKTIGYQSFRKLVEEGLDYERFLEKISKTDRLQTADLAYLYNKGSIEFYYSTYSTMIHEFGHAFALCDTYDAGKVFCDPQYTTDYSGPSVMKDSTYFYLTEDDREGVLEAFRRFF